MVLPLPKNLPSVKPQVLESLRLYARQYKPIV